MAAKVILVVDDDPRMQELIQTYLSRYNVEIHAAFTGQGA